MTKLTIHHRTTYSYRRPVGLQPHRLLLRPREGAELRLLRHEISISPEAELRWTTDVFGNAIATAVFVGLAEKLVVDSLATVELFAPAYPIFDVASSALSYPFRYSDEEWTDLGALVVQQYADPGGRLQDWARAFIARNGTDTLSLLKDLSAGVPAWISYQSREAQGTQAPLETLQRGWGSCRDFAVLFVEAARNLGFGARIVSGYLFNPSGDSAGTEAAGSTHAWAEVFVPGAGWIAFDPTNSGIGGANLIPVAVARGIDQATPVSGSYSGFADAFLSMDVSVSIVEEDAVKPDTHLGPSGSTLIYRSENGDCWWLILQRGGPPVVRHTPNRASGGRNADFIVSDFLERDRGNPEAVELLALLSRMKEKADV